MHNMNVAPQRQTTEWGTAGADRKVTTRTGQGGLENLREAIDQEVEQDGARKPRGLAD